MAERGGGAAEVLARERVAEDGHRPAVLQVLPGEVAPGDERRAHRAEVVRRRPLVAADRRHLPLGPGLVFHPHRIVAVDAVHRHRRGQAHRGDAGDGLDAAEDLLVRGRGLQVVLDHRLGDGDAHREDLFRRREPRLHVPHRQERADHQARRHQQHEGQRHLRHHQRVPRAMPLAAVARAAAAFLQRGAEPRVGVLRDRDAVRTAAPRRHEAASTNPTTMGSMAISSRRGSCAGLSASSRRMPP